MKRTISLWLGLLAFALLPALAQTPAPTKPTGKIHGHITNPTGASQSGGTVSLVSAGSASSSASKGTFTVDGSGNYSGEVATGSYDAIYRSPGVPADKMTDRFTNLKIVAGQDLLQDFDMTRKEYIDLLSPEEKKQLEELKKKNADSMKVNEIIKTLNADLKTAVQGFKEADGARDTAIAALGAGASKSDLDAKEAEIRIAKYTAIEAMMLKDTGAKPDASVLWVQLGQAQLGLARTQKDQAKYDQSEASFKKALDLEGAAKTPNIATLGAANAGLGEVYARTGKIPEANAAYDAAAKINPTQAAFYLRNEMVIYFQENNPDAQVAAAEEVIKADPSIALAYYLKGNGLVGKATVDPKTNKLIAPPGCEEAYQKYLELSPTGQYAGDVKAILVSLQATLPPNAPAKKKK